ncbi:MAG: P1 family peptidase, partial [Woeseia sp.]
GQEDGSIMMVVATDAPLTARALDRLAMRAMLGLARTGSFASNGSGDYVIAFSTHPDVRRPRGGMEPFISPSLTNEAMSPLFAATAEATEEAIYNALLKATTVESSRGKLEAINIADVRRILKKYNSLNWDKTLSPQR